MSLKIDGAPKRKLRTEDLLFTFVVWYGFSATYNVFNAYSKVDLQLPYANASIQLGVGLLYALPLWLMGVRSIPSLSLEDLIKMTPIALLNIVGHVLTVNATFQKGGGSFTHVIKASEPVVNVVLAFFMYGAVP